MIGINNSHYSTKIKNYLIKLLLILSIVYSQHPERNEIIYERYPNGFKKLISIFEVSGKNQVLLGSYGFYDNGLKRFSQLYNNDKKHGKSIFWNITSQIANNVNLLAYLFFWHYSFD